MPFWQHGVADFTPPRNARLKRLPQSCLDLLRLDVSGTTKDGENLALPQNISPAQYASPKKFNSFNENCLTRDDFEDIRFIARGSFGKVSLVKHKPTQRLFALKEMAGVPGNEDKIKKLGSEEAQILKAIRHPFIVGLQYVFFGHFSVCLAMDYVSGDDLWTLMYEKKQAPMSEERAVLYLAQIVLALEYLHNNDIIYCDLKSENVMIDLQGYVRLVDFGCARRLRANETCAMKCGTIQCLAPEALSVYFDDKGEYSFSADYWSLGVLAYEMIIGAAPFTFDPANESPKQFAERISILSKELRFPSNVSESAADFIRGLLNPSPSLRFGKKIRNHRVFADVDINNLIKKTISVPRSPSHTANPRI